MGCLGVAGTLRCIDDEMTSGGYRGGELPRPLRVSSLWMSPRPPPPSFSPSSHWVDAGCPPLTDPAVRIWGGQAGKKESFGSRALSLLSRLRLVLRDCAGCATQPAQSAGCKGSPPERGNVRGKKVKTKVQVLHGEITSEQNPPRGENMVVGCVKVFRRPDRLPTGHSPQLLRGC